MKTESGVAQTFKAGDWAVTAGGTVDKAQKLVELRDTSYGALIKCEGGVWEYDGSIWRGGGSTEHRYGPLLRLATPEEIKAGRVLPETVMLETKFKFAEGAYPAMVGGKTFKHKDHPEAVITLTPHHFQPLIPSADDRAVQLEVNRRHHKVAEALASGATRPKGWAASTLVTIGGKKRQLRTLPRTQLMGQVAKFKEVWEGAERSLSDALESLDAVTKARDTANARVKELEGHDVNLRRSVAQWQEEARAAGDVKKAWETRYKMVSAFATGAVDEIIVPDEDDLIRSVRKSKDDFTRLRGRYDALLARAKGNVWRHVLAGAVGASIVWGIAVWH